MIVVRAVARPRYGKSDALVQLIKESNEMWPIGRNRRILTDLSGPICTVITEVEIESLSEWEAQVTKSFGDSRYTHWLERVVALMERGNREFYILVE